jgi:(p)ppGpp synthase/HD superfamily hydrolase
MSTLEKAIVIAAEAHAGQVDKAGAPYILHPLRLMLQMEKTEDRIVAVLHDVVEDTDWTLEGLRKEGFHQVIIDAIDSVTWRKHEDYEDFIQRAAQNQIGSRVKLADLRDNSDLSRIANPQAKDFKRVDKYRWAIRMIEGHVKRNAP